MKKLLTPLVAASLFAACSASAQTTLFTFGSNAYTGTNAPGHVNDSTITGTDWNTLATDTGSGIVDQNGNATSISVNFGRETGVNTDILDFSAATKAASFSLFSGFDGTIFDSNLGTNNVVRDTGGNVGVGFSLTGLQTGEYNFYLTAFRGDGGTPTAGNNGRYTIYSAVSSSTPTTDFSSASALGTISNTNKSTWESGNNYITGSVTISSTNDYLTFFSDGFRTDTGDFIGVANSLEIAAVPEPSTYALLAGLLTLFCSITFRRRR